jgi:hypothetical protein
MRIEPSGAVFIGECDIQSSRCTAKSPAPVSAVFSSPHRRQINVCRACLDYMVANGEWELDHSKIAETSDYIVSDERGCPLLVAEVKTPPPHEQANPSLWAMRVHRNLLVHGAVPLSRYFLLVAAPGTGYLWKRGEDFRPDDTPDFEFDLLSDFPELEGEAETISEDALAKALPKAFFEIGKLEGNVRQRDWLTRSGLLEDLIATRLQKIAA